MKIVIDDRIPYIRGAAERLGRAVYLPGAAIGPDDVRDADALIVRTRTRCDRRLLEGSRVQFVATATIGFDHLDTAWLARAGIAVGADGLFIETHEDPSVAKSDGANMLRLDLLEGLLERLVRIRRAITEA